MTGPGRALAALLPVLECLDRLGVPYFVTGSVASSAYGVPRSTLDVDLVVGLRAAHVLPLCRSLEGAYYVSEDAARSAVGRGSTFNLVHLASMVKVDLYVLKDEPYEREAFARRSPRRIAEGAPEVFLPSPEDVVLRKLAWYRKGGETSERQWGDVLGVLRVSGANLDREYLDRWAKDLGIGDLLLRAREESAGP